MAAPGLGIGDIVSACNFMYNMCVKYKDAPSEFDEIAEKAKSTAVVLARIEAEAAIKGNLVDRAGPEGYSQLKGHLKGLRSDSKKLESLVAKYGKIHDEGAGRRLLFTLKESGGLTDLRRRIGLHEQMLQIWYMTLVYGSLRRLESGQQGILSAIEAMNTWSQSTMRKIQQSLREGDSKPLERELRKSGLEPRVVDEALGTAVDYVEAPPLERVRMQSHARSSAAVYPEETSSRPSPRPSNQEYAFDTSFNDEGPSYPPPPPKPHTHRRRHSKRDARDEHKEEDLPKKEREKPSKDQDPTLLTADFGRPRSSSQTPKPTPPSPLLVVPDTVPRQRPASYHESSDQYDHLSPHVGSRYKQEQFITLDRTPRRHRSVSREVHPETGIEETIRRILMLDGEAL